MKLPNKYTKTYGIKNMHTLYLTALKKSSLRIERKALVIPQPGQGKLKNFKKMQLMPKVLNNMYVTKKYSVRSKSV